jgi:lysine 2,3-aminomutase
MLVDAGCPVNNQAVLMRGVNDTPEVMKELMLKLLKMRVRPYYLFMADETKGASHFRTSLDTGLNIMDHLRGHISGLAIPYFVIDAPGGGGKIPMLPEYVLHRDKDKIILRNYKHQNYIYRETKGETQIQSDTITIQLSDKKNGNGKSHKKSDKITGINVPEFELIDN